jgi:hypothetical protein
MTIMPDQNNQRPDSPLLNRLQTPQQKGARSFLRVLGPVILVAGLICTIGGMVSVFSSFGSFEPPRYFWLCFIGLPLMFVGGVMSQFGFMGAVARYVAGEGAPVAADTINYVADETKGSVETVARAAAKGIVAGIEEGRATASFCPHCGNGVKADFKFCPKCGKPTAVS